MTKGSEKTGEMAGEAAQGPSHKASPSNTELEIHTAIRSFNKCASIRGAVATGEYFTENIETNRPASSFLDLNKLADGPMSDHRLVQLEVNPFGLIKVLKLNRKMVARVGFEPTTFGL